MFLPSAAYRIDLPTRLSSIGYERLFFLIFCTFICSGCYSIIPLITFSIHILSVQLTSSYDLAIIYNIPEDIEIINQEDQMPNQGVQMMDPINQQGQPAEGAAQGVYVGGTYPATLARAAQGTSSYRPPQFAFTTPPTRTLHEECG